MTRFAIMLGALALPVALAAQEPTPQDTTQRRSSEPVFLSADSVAKLRAAAERDAAQRAAESAARRAKDSIEAHNRALAADSMRRAGGAVAMDTAHTDTLEAHRAVAATPRTTETMTTELSYTPEPGGVWLRSTSSTTAGLSRGFTRGPDGRVFARPIPDGGVWMVAMRDGDDPQRVVSAPVAGVTREESAGDVAPALSTSVRTSFTEMSRADVREMQGALTDAGCPTGAIDGIVGPRTRRAIACAERKYELSGGDLTALFEALNLRLTSDLQ